MMAWWMKNSAHFTVKSLNISPRNLTLGDTTNLSYSVENAIKKFENHPSVQIIKKHIRVDQDHSVLPPFKLPHHV